MAITFSREQPDSPTAAALISELEALLAPLYAPESRHGYSVEKLLQRGVDFFVLRVDGQPAGCCGLEIAGPEYGEIKRMYVRPPFRGNGLGRIMLEQLVVMARENNLRLLRLETGVFQQAAIQLYERFGFRRIGPFGPYQTDPSSLFYELAVTDSL